MEQGLLRQEFWSAAVQAVLKDNLYNVKSADVVFRIEGHRNQLMNVFQNEKLLHGSAFKNLTRLNRSSSNLFTIGVPIRTHLCAHGSEFITGSCCLETSIFNEMGLIKYDAEELHGELGGVARRAPTAKRSGRGT
jgi:hypothetical protein